MGYLKEIERAIELFSSLPMIGPKTAQRLTFWLVKEKEKIDEIMAALKDIRDRVEPCKVCFSLTLKDRQPCDICMDDTREPVLCVVANPSDVLIFEEYGIFRGYYHVLGGLISPLDGVGPESLRIEELINRLKSGKYKEVLFALPPTVEGDTTSFYIAKRIEGEGIKVRLSRLAHGLPVGAQLDYADTLTLVKALENRQPLNLEEER